MRIDHVDALGDLLSTTDPLGHQTSYSYDANSHLVKTTFPDATVETRSYDANGRLTEIKDTTSSATFDSPCMTASAR